MGWSLYANMFVSILNAMWNFLPSHPTMEVVEQKNVERVISEADI